MTAVESSKRLELEATADLLNYRAKRMRELQLPRLGMMLDKLAGDIEMELRKLREW